MMATPQISVLMKVLRELLRARGIRHRDIAERLQVSERTVTRWFSDNDIGLRPVEDLCGMLDLSFFDLCELASSRVEDRISRLTSQQEQALVESALLVYVFRQILKGWTAQEISAEREIPEADLVGALMRLQKLGLIEVLPHNQIRLRTIRNIEWSPRGPYSRSANQWLTRCVQGADIGEPNSVWAFDEIKLSGASVAQLREKFDRLLEDVIELADGDRRRNPGSRDWYACILALRPMEVPPYPDWPDARSHPRLEYPTAQANAPNPAGSAPVSKGRSRSQRPGSNPG